MARKISTKMNRGVISRLEKDRTGYDAQITSQSELLDKSILLIGTTTFNMALIFIDRIVKMEKAEYIFLFIISLSSLALSIVLTILSFKLSVCDAYHEIKEVDKYISDKNHVRKSLCIQKIIEPINWFSLIFMIIGFICMVVFISINICIQEVITHV